MHLIVHLVVHLTNQMFMGRMQMLKVHIQMLNIYNFNAHSNAQHLNAHSNAFAFVNKPHFVKDQSFLVIYLLDDIIVYNNIGTNALLSAIIKCIISMCGQA